MSQRIARMDSDELLANADEVVEAAQEKLSALCTGEPWRMSVPVQDEDSDVPIGAVIRLAARLRDELYAARLAVTGQTPDQRATADRSTVRCQKCGHTGVPSPTVVLDLEEEIRELRAKLEEQPPSVMEQEGVRCVRCTRWHDGIGADDHETDTCDDCWKLALFEDLRPPLLYYFGTTDPDLLAEVWAEQAKARDALRTPAGQPHSEGGA